MATPIDVFICYAPKDEGLLIKLESHLASLKWQGLVRAWSDRSVLPGERRKETLGGRLASSHVILLLISSDFLASFDREDGEMGHVLERERMGDARVVPILLRPCDWKHEPLADLQALPKNQTPVSQWTDTDAALLDVVSGLREVVQGLTRHLDEVDVRGRAKAPEAADGSPAQVSTPERSSEPVNGARAASFESLPPTRLAFFPWPNLTGPLWWSSLPTTKLRLFPWNDEAS